MYMEEAQERHATKLAKTVPTIQSYPPGLWELTTYHSTEWRGVGRKSVKTPSSKGMSLGTETSWCRTYSGWPVCSEHQPLRSSLRVVEDAEP